MRRYPREVSDRLLASVGGRRPETALSADGLQVLVSAAAFHGVSAQLLRWLQEHEDAPASVLRALDTARLTAAMQHLRARATLAWLEKSISDVDWLVFKGPVLAESYYERIDERPYGDIDILVAPFDLPRFAAQLTAAGGVPYPHDWSQLIRQRAGELAWRAPTGIMIDLHWHLINSASMRRSLGAESASLLARSRLVRIGSRDYRTLSLADTLIHLALHSCKSGGERLLWYVDLDRVVRAEDVPAAEFATGIREHGAALAVAAALGRANRLLGTPTRQFAMPTTRHRFVDHLVGLTGHLSGPPRAMGRPSLDRFIHRSLRDDLPTSLRAVVSKARIGVVGSRRHAQSAVPPEATVDDLMKAAQTYA